MRLLFVNSAWTESWGGGEKWTVEAASWFQLHGHETLVTVRHHSRLKSAVLEKELSVIETPFGGDFDPTAIGRALSILRSYRPNLVVVNFNKEAWQFGSAAKLCSIPVVARHGFPLFKTKRSHRLLRNHIITRLTVNAGSIRDDYSRLGFAVEDVKVIHNGVAAVPQKAGDLRHRFYIGKNDPLILAAGRLEPQKRFDRLIDVALRVIPTHPAARFLIAGEGPLQGELQGRIAACSLEKHVFLTGFIAGLNQIIGDADIFVLTSDNEGTPNILLEAMAAEVACLSTIAGAVPDIFGESLAENMFAPQHTDQMASRLTALLDQPALRKDTAEKMKARVLSEFSVDVSMRQFETLFRELTELNQ